MKNLFTISSLQMFAAGGGELVNASTQYVNAYTGQGTPFSGVNSLTVGMKTLYDTALLENTKVKMVYAQFAKRQPLPKNHGRIVEWRKWNAFPAAKQLVEGVIPTGEKMGQTHITGTIVQYGLYTAISDIVQTHIYDDILGGASKELANSGSETQEKVTRNALLTNTNVFYCPNVDATGAVKGTQPTSCATMAANNTDGWARLTPKVVHRVATNMRKNKVPTINGKYVAVIHPDVAHDLREDPEWKDFHRYSATEEIWNGYIGELHGVRFIENPFAPVLGGSTYQNKDGGVTYATFFFGEDSFAIIDVAGGNLEFIFHDRKIAGGPLEQFSTAGYKLESNGATVLYPERLVRVMSVTSESATEQPNE